MSTATIPAWAEEPTPAELVALEEELAGADPYELDHDDEQKEEPK